MAEGAPQRHLLWVTIIAGLGLAVWCLTTAFYSLPSNVLSTRDGGAARRVSVTLFPQGWGFFTLSPTTEEYAVYGVVGTRMTNLQAVPQSRARNLFGWSRRQRAQGPELASLANRVDTWRECTGGVGPACREEVLDDVPQPLANTSPVPTICGRVVVVSTTPVPWSYRHDYVQSRIDQTAALVQVSC